MRRASNCQPWRAIILYAVLDTATKRQHQLEVAWRLRISYKQLTARRTKMAHVVYNTITTRLLGGNHYATEAAAKAAQHSSTAQLV